VANIKKMEDACRLLLEYDALCRSRDASNKQRVAVLDRAIELAREAQFEKGEMVDDRQFVVTDGGGGGTGIG
jgi:uncharacterized membrane protein